MYAERTAHYLSSATIAGVLFVFLFASCQRFSCSHGHGFELSPRIDVPGTYTEPYMKQQISPEYTYLL